METTRHFVTTVFVVNDGAVALHEHDRLNLWLPPGGHIERDELPHEAAKREVSEEIGLTVQLVKDLSGYEAAQARPIPRPQQLLLEDINVHHEEVGHQHIDFVYYGHVQSRDITPRSDEAPASAWRWFDKEDLQNGPDNLTEDVIGAGSDAIDIVMEHR